MSLQDFSLRDFILRDMRAYTTDAERAAYRAGMSSAAMICDDLRIEIERGNTSIRGRKITKMGASLALIAQIAGDRITEFRNLVTTSETSEEAANRTKIALIRKVLG